ncbi:hypothetical protein D9M70_549190 [compost metagenome]
MKALLDDTTMLGLQFGAERLGREGPTSAVIKSEEISQFLSDLQALLARVLDSDLPKDLKHLFARNLEQLRHALIAFRISGVEGLVDELDRSIGSVLRHQSDIKQQAGDEGKELFQTFFQLMERMNQAVTFAQNAQAIAAPTMTALLSVFTTAS